MNILNSIVEFVLKLDMMGYFMLATCLILLIIFIIDAIENYKEDNFERRFKKK